jgi:hypothetical protein
MTFRNTILRLSVVAIFGAFLGCSNDTAKGVVPTGPNVNVKSVPVKGDQKAKAGSINAPPNP